MNYAMADTILNIMETWPLQLVLQTSTGKVQMMLAEDTNIKHGREEHIDPGKLRPGQHVRVLKRAASGAIAELEIID